MSYASRIAAREDAEDEARDRAAARSRCPKAEALADDIRAQLDRSDIALDPRKADARAVLELLLVGVDGLIDTGHRDIRPEEEADLRARMREVGGEQAVEVPGLPQEADGRAVQQVPVNAAVAPQEREPRAMPMMDDVYGGNTLKAEDLPQNFRAVLTVESVSVQEFENREDKSRTDKKLVLRFQGKDKGLALNVTNANMMAEITKSRDYDHWPGHAVTLFRTMTDYAGKRVPALRLDYPNANGGGAPAPRPAAPPPPPPPPPQFQATDDDVPF